MGVELEVKYAANDATLARIRADLPDGETIKMATTYYDTPDGRLSKKRYTLRRRLENGISVCTVKTPLDRKSRGEWDTECDGIPDAIPRLCALGAPKDLAEMTRDGVIPICGARFTRRAIPIANDAFTAELALDQGVLTGGQRECPLCEVELEYKSGDADAFLLFCEAFSKTYSLCPEPLSKFRRALNLYLGEK